MVIEFAEPPETARQAVLRHVLEAREILADEPASTECWGLMRALDALAEAIKAGKIRSPHDANTIVAHFESAIAFLREDTPPRVSTHYERRMEENTITGSGHAPDPLSI